MSLSNRHPVDELADLRKQMHQTEQRIEELRELIISGACSLVGDEHAATLEERTSQRVDIKELRREFREALTPVLREHRATRVNIRILK